MIQLKEAVDGRHYFNVRANNNEVVSSSQMYDFPSGAKSGAEALLKATGTYWQLAFATIIEEAAQAIGEIEGRDMTVSEISKLLMSQTNESLQEIVDRIPYTK